MRRGKLNPLPENQALGAAAAERRVGSAEQIIANLLVIDEIGAGMNVKINASSLKDRQKAEALIAEANAIIEKANAEEKEITATVEKMIS